MDDERTRAKTAAEFSELFSAAKSSNISKASKFDELVALIANIGRDLRVAEAGNKACLDRLRRSIQRARYLIRDCHIEVEQNERSQEIRED